MSSKFAVVIDCASAEEVHAVSSLITKYRLALNHCWQAELGHDCDMTDGQIVKECMIDGLRVTRKALRLLHRKGE